MRDDKTANSTAGTAKAIMDDPDTLTLQGRTLYVTSARNDVGLGLAAGAKAVTIQMRTRRPRLLPTSPMLPPPSLIWLTPAPLTASSTTARSTRFSTATAPPSGLCS